MVSKALINRLSYRHGLPFITSVFLAAVITAWPRVRDVYFHKGTSIWTIAILVTLSTAFAVLCGGRFRTFFTAVAVTPPFLLFLFGELLRLRSVMLDYPIWPFVQYFLYFVAAPILLAWIVATLFNRKEQRA